MKKIITQILFFALLYPYGVRGQNVNSQDSLRRGFQNPPVSANLSAYWQWMGGHITREGITRDLEAMSKNGITDVNLFNLSSYQESDFGIPKVKFASGGWMEMFRHTLREANRLGMVVGAENCDGWSQSGGSWVPVDKSMKQYIWSKTQLRGGQAVNIRLDKPVGKTKNFYRDICVVAFRSPVQSGFYQKSHIKTTEGQPVTTLTDGNPVSCYYLKADQSVDIQFKESYLVEKVLIHIQKVFEWKNDKFNATFELQKSNDGINYSSVSALKVNCLNEPVVLNIPATEATCFRLVSKNRNVEIAELALLKNGERGLFHPQISFHQIKTVTTQAQNMNDYFAQSNPTDQKYFIPSVAEVIDISQKMTQDGQLYWQVPEGNWTIIRMGYSGTGKTNSMGTIEGTGYECDKMDTTAVNLFFDGYAQKLIDASGQYKGNTFKYLLIDSWECGYQNWTSGFEKEFLKRRGYSIIPFVPVLCGEIVGNSEYSEAFLHDFRKTISDLIGENYYRHMAELCHRNGLKLHSEVIYGDIPLPGGAPYPPLDILKVNSYIDEPTTEFWARINPLDTSLSYNLNHRIYSTFPAHAAKMYGKPIVGSEAYTSYESYSTSPWNLKLWGDKAYTEGVNKFILHSYVHQPVEKKPGFTLSHFGNAFNRHNTWWESSGSWFEFQRRVQFILQKGNTVSDILVYAGDRLPLRGNAPTSVCGFRADYCNADLLGGAKVEHGNILLTNGYSYQLLMLNDNAIEFSTLRKIDELVRSGAKVICPKPDRMLSLNDLSDENRYESVRIIKRLWSHADPSLGGNAIISDSLSIRNLKNDVLPDFLIKGAIADDFMFIHKRDANSDYYYLVSLDSVRTKHVEISFRIKGKRPEIWDPVDASVQKPMLYSTSDNYTSLPISFDPKQSLFVVFRSSDSIHFEKLVDDNAKQLFPSALNKMDRVPSFRSNKEWVTCSVPVKGHYVLSDNCGKQLSFDANNEEVIALNNARITLLDEPTVKPFTVNCLKSLTLFGDSLIKYYSGTAEYAFEFTFPKRVINKKKQIFLNLGRFGATAQAELNGNLLPVEWVPNRRTEITSLLNPGRNKLLVRVTNPWRNRLIGDARNNQKAKRWTTLPLYNSKEGVKQELLQSGLADPVRIIIKSVVAAK